MTAAERIERFWAKVDKSGECWTWTGARDASGYGLFGVRPSRSERSHRFSYRTTSGDIPTGMCVLHRCDNPSCVRPSHLFLGTRGDNMRDRQTKERQARGERSGRALLRTKDVLEIRQLRTAGIQLKDIAQRFGVAPETVSAIVHRRSWRHV